MPDDTRSVEMFLFRLKLEPYRRQRSLAELSINRPDLLFKLLSLVPSYQFSKKSIFRTSKIDNISETEHYFEVGIEYKKDGAKFDKIKKSFIAHENEITDFAHCFYESKIQLLVIEKKTGLPAPKTLASRLALAIEQIKTITEVFSCLTQEEQMLFINSRCKADVIYEPSEFLKIIKNAYKVLKFNINIPMPNPVDFNDMIQKPVSELMSDVNASTSTVTVENKKEGLDTHRLIGLTHDLSAYGAGASARVKKEENSNSEYIKLNKDEHSAKINLQIPQTMLMVHFKEHGKEFMQTIIDKFSEVSTC